jgi:REP element-mobilizing transposase RayT
MFDYHIKTGEAIWIDEEDEIIITEAIAEIVKESKNSNNGIHSIDILEYNICGDHLHMLLVCEKEEVPKIVGKLKGKSSRLYHSNKGINPLVRLNGETAIPLWTQKFGNSRIKDEEYLRNAINYIRNNRKKHGLPENKKLRKIIDEMICTTEHAFRTEYKGGFDVVIGNPPYVRSRGLMLDSEKAYFVDNYKTASYQLDLYKLFIEKSLRLINTNGKLSFITPSVFLSNDFDKPLRKFILDNYNFSQISTTNEEVFADASVKTVVFVIDKNTQDKTITFFNIRAGLFEYKKSISKDNFIELDYTINENIDLDSLGILGKLQRLKKLDDFFIVKNGIKVRKELLYNHKVDINHKPFLLGKNIKIYSLNYDSNYIHYLPENEKLYTNQAFRTQDIFEQEKLIVRQILGKRIVTTFDDENYYTDQTTYVINKKTDKTDLHYLLTILNSKIIYYYFSNIFSDNKTTFPKVKRSQLLELPIVELNKEKQDYFIQKSKQMLELNKQFQQKKSKFLNRVKDNFEIEKTSKKLDAFYNFDFKIFIAELKKQKVAVSLTEQVEWEEFFNNYKAEINYLQSEIDKTDKEINQMVYELYGLSEEEIEIVEKSAKET